MTEQELREVARHTIIGAVLGTLSIDGATDAIMALMPQWVPVTPQSPAPDIGHLDTNIVVAVARPWGTPSVMMYPSCHDIVQWWFRLPAVPDPPKEVNE
jgi:hypothetical protein